MTEEDLNKYNVPRLQIKCTNVSGDYKETEWSYDLVYKHFTNEIVYINMGSTKIEKNKAGISLNEDGTLDLPIRNGVHIKHDAITLNLLAFAICGDIIEKIDLVKFKKKFPDKY
nr:hypothetical protein [Paenibacillus xylanexedens]